MQVVYIPTLELERLLSACSRCLELQTQVGLDSTLQRRKENYSAGMANAIRAIGPTVFEPGSRGWRCDEGRG